MFRLLVCLFRALYSFTIYHNALITVYRFKRFRLAAFNNTLKLDTFVRQPPETLSLVQRLGCKQENKMYDCQLYEQTVNALHRTPPF
jgi:hypothetical protein